MKLRNLFLTAVAAVTLAACGNQTSKQETTKETKPAEHVKVAVVGSAAHEIWDFVAEKAKKENINLEVVEMNDYVLPNTALEEGSVHLNAFQHIYYILYPLKLQLISALLTRTIISFKDFHFSFISGS